MYEKLKQLSENRMKYFASEIENLVWYQGSDNFFEELPNEIEEAKEQDKKNNHVYLEDELGDVFWDYLMLLQSLKYEWKITSIDAIMERAYNKFRERVWEDGHANVEDWAEWDRIKKIQKQRLKQEHENIYSK